MQLARSLLEKDFRLARERLESRQGQEVHLMLKDENNIFHWSLEVSGHKNTLWEGE